MVAPVATQRKRVRWYPSTCKECGKKGTPKKPISSRGLCPRCGIQKEVAALTQLNAKEGPVYDHYRQRVAESLGLANAHPEGEG